MQIVMKLYIIAGEKSGDIHGALLLKNLLRLMPDADNINFALGDVMSITAGGSRWRYVGAFFRFNYA